MRRPRPLSAPRPLVGLVGVLTATTLVLAGCSDSSSSGTADGTPVVVTSTDVWGSVAAAVAGDDAEVTSLYTGAEGDPHEFEPTAADTAEIVDADIIVMNGGHYDAYLEKTADSGSATVVDAYALSQSEDHGSDDHGSDDHGTDDHGTDEDHGAHDHGAHDHGLGANEHVFYDLTTVSEVAEHLADALAEKAPEHADAFRANAEAFRTEIDGLRSLLADIKVGHDGTEVAQTEPLAGYLLTEAGLVDVAPAGFTQAVEAGQSPSAADRAKMEDLITSRTAHVLIYNTQAVDPVTKALLPIAASADVAVVEFTESLPEGVTSYVDWQRAQIEALTAALDAAPASTPAAS